LPQGEVPKYRGAPPGFWELWNSEKKAGVTIHFVDEGVDTGPIIDQQTVPIFEYDNLLSLQAKLGEVSLTLYPNAIRQIAAGNNKRVIQECDAGKQYSFPTLEQRIQLWLKIARRQFNIVKFVKTVLKAILTPMTLLAIAWKDHLLMANGKGILSVLYYHRITNICKDGMTVTIEDFENQIRYLKKHYKIVSAADLTQFLNANNGKLIQAKMVLLTFDDGYEDNYTNALPILETYSCPAIFFVSTGLIGNEKQFEHDHKLQPQLKFRKMTWEQLKHARHSNVEIGVHTHSHADLGELPLEKSVEEIETSINEYVKHLGEKPKFMSYPFGLKKDITADVVKYIEDSEPITALFSAYGMKNLSVLNIFDIKRLNIGTNDKGLAFSLKVEGGYSYLLSPHN